MLEREKFYCLHVAEGEGSLKLTADEERIRNAA